MYVSKFIFQGLSGSLFENCMIFLWSKHSSALTAGKTQSGKSKDRTSRKNKDNMWLAESDSTTGSELPESQSIHCQHHQRVPCWQRGPLPGCQVFCVLWGNFALPSICWFSSLAQDKLQKGKSELGPNQSNNYLVRTYYVQSNSAPIPALGNLAVP